MSLTFSKKLLAWFDKHGRKNLPWQQNPTPYHIWLSEIMLQQTQVATVITYYQRFVNTFASIHELAAAPIEDVLALWAGLGYYARARNLHKTAGIIVLQYQGSMPTKFAQLVSLPGIGRSTAGAIMALAYQKRYAILDGNVKRVLARYYAISGWPGNKKVENQLWQHAEKLLPKNQVASYIQAQMDLGATVCTRNKPRCTCCPLQTDCVAFQGNMTQYYPFSKPKKTTPTRQTNWLVALTPDGKVLLEKRPNHGIWGGLWSFPEYDQADDIKIISNAKFHINISNISAQPRIHHVFTHFKLDIYPYVAQCTVNHHQINKNKKIIWYTIEEALRVGLPAPV